MSHYFAHINDPFYQAVALLGLFILLFGLVSLFVKERLYLAESLVALLFGIIFGPVCLQLIQPKNWFADEATLYRFTLEFARIIISLQVMAVGLCTPFEYLKKEWKSIAMLLVPAMVFMWVVSATIVFLVMGFDWWESMMIGACLAPTDPILANAVIKGKFANRYIPSHLRNLLSVESGANDGLGFPFLMLPLFMTRRGGNVGLAMADWFLTTWLYEILFSIVIGFVLGFGAKKLLEKSEEWRLIDKDSFLVYSIALSLSITGLVALISSDDLLSVFIAGNVFAYDDKFHQATKDAHFQEILDMLFNISFFIFLGAIFPWRVYYDMHLGFLTLTAVLIIFFRRLPFIMACRKLIPALRSNKEAFFCGWFGPMGVGAIFFAMVCVNDDSLPATVKSNVFTVVSFVVLSSIIIHGITVPITHISLKTKAKYKMKKQMKGSGNTLPDGDLPLEGISKTDGKETNIVLLTDALTSELQSDSENGYMTASNEEDQEKKILAEKVQAYNDDPYAETLDLRGLKPEQVLEKLLAYGNPTEKTKAHMPESLANEPLGGAAIPFGRTDTFGSSGSSSFV